MAFGESIRSVFGISRNVTGVCGTAVNDQSSEVWLHGVLAIEEVANDVLKTMNVRLKLKLANAVNPVLEEFDAEDILVIKKCKILFKSLD